MNKITRKHIVIRPRDVSRVAAQSSEDSETIGGTVLSADRKRQELPEALRDSIEHNLAALKKLSLR